MTELVDDPKSDRLLGPRALLAALADGRAHSGEELARRFGVTRAAVWKQMAKLGDWHVQVQATPGRGYRLARPLELLDAAKLHERLGVRAAHTRLEVFTELDSTNRYLLEHPPENGVLGACLAEFQTAGRGRRGRAWRAPLGAGLCLSVGWRFERMPAELSALTLAAGVVVRRALGAAASVQPQLKWPNDLVWDGRKLGGILVEMSGEAQGDCHVVIGVGVNVALPRPLLSRLSDWPGGAVDLAAAGVRPARNELAAALLAALGDLCRGYEATGFAPYRRAWQSADYLRGRAVTVEAPAGPVAGTALGIDRDGALLVKLPSGRRTRVIAGDVTVRAR